MAPTRFSVLFLLCACSCFSSCFEATSFDEGALSSALEGPPPSYSTATATAAVDADGGENDLFSSSSSPRRSRRRLGRLPTSLGRLSSSILKKVEEEQQQEETRRHSFAVVDTATAVPLDDDNNKGEEEEEEEDFSSHFRFRRNRGRQRQSHSFPPKTATIDIYVRTYKGDAAWLTWLLRSIEDNVEAAAFRRVVLSANRRDAAFFLRLLERRRFGFDVLFLVSDDAAFETATRAMNSVTPDGGYHAQMWDKVG